MTVRHIDFWFDFASTYSYPASQRIRPLAHAHGVTVRFRPFLLGPLFKAQGWGTSPFNLYPAKGRYMWRDLERLCRALDLPLVRPEPFPQNSLLAARLAVAADGEAWRDAFCERVFRAEFGEGRPIDDARVLGSLIADLGGDAASLLARSGSTEIKDRLRRETDEASRRGLFGAPSFVTPDGELFWGNDRLEAALAWP